MHRFLIENIKFQDNIILEDKEIIFQLRKVLRFFDWEKIVLFNGKDNSDYIYEIINLGKNTIFLKLEKVLDKKSELNFSLVLYQALPNKISKLEYILQKAIEVWFKKIVFFKSDRSQKLNITDNKKKRFDKIVLEAIEQSDRNILPIIKYLDILNLESRNILWENIFLHTKKTITSLSLKNLKLDYKKNINIFIWPEWGFSKSENMKFSDLNFKKFYLWNRILRTETAWVVVWFFISQIF
jgi:RsmE family RNA methyltransferase